MRPHGWRARRARGAAPRSGQAHGPRSPMRISAWSGSSARREVTIVSLTVSSELRGGVSVVKLGGAVEDDVLASVLHALRALSEDDGPLVIDLDELTICSRAPFEALLHGERNSGG